MCSVSNWTVALVYTAIACGERDKEQADARKPAMHTQSGT